MQQMPDFPDRRALHAWFDACRPPTGEYPIAFRCHGTPFYLLSVSPDSGALTYINKATSDSIVVALRKHNWTRQLSETFFMKIDIGKIPEEVLKYIPE